MAFTSFPIPTEILDLDYALLHYGSSQENINSYRLGEDIPNNGVANASVMIQRAVNALGLKYQADGIPRQLILPAGRYRLNTEIAWRPGVGLSCDVRSSAVLLPYGENAAINGNQSGNPLIMYRHCFFDNIEVDGINQTSAVRGSAVKGIFIQFMMDSYFRHVTIRNVQWTGFGLDYLQRVGFVECHAENCGRGVTPSATWNGAGSGFGIANGYYDVEECWIVNCVAVGNLNSNGFFLENKFGAGSGAGFPDKFSRGFKLIGSTGRGNKYGYTDGGGDGAIAIGNDLSDNLVQGFHLGATPANFSAGKNGIFQGNIISRNGYGVGAANPCGIEVREHISGTYDISQNLIEENFSYGILGGASMEIRHGARIRSNMLRRNKQSAIRLYETDVTNILRGLVIADNDCDDNVTDPAATYTDAIYLRASMDCPTIVNNRARNSEAGGGKQARVVHLPGNSGTNYITTSPLIKDNDGVFMTTRTAVRVAQTIADQTGIVGNTARGVLNPAWTDTFSGTDGPISGRSTTTGVWQWGVYSDTGGNAPSVVGNAVGCPTWTGGIARAYVDNGASDGTFSAVCTALGAGRRARLAFRLSTATDGSYEIVAGTTTNNNWTLIVRTTSGVMVIQDLGIASAANDLISVTAAGASLSVSINGTVRYTGTMTEHLSATKWGFTFSDADSRWDNAVFA